MAIKNRSIPSNKIKDPASIDAIIYSEAAGSRKSSEVGSSLLPLAIPGTGTGYTTDASSVRVLPALGKNLAIYNNDTAVHAVTLSRASVSALAAGATDSSGNVGIPCPPALWTYVAAADRQFVITDSNKLLVFIIEDPTFVIAQPQDNAST